MTRLGARLTAVLLASLVARGLAYGGTLACTNNDGCPTTSYCRHPIGACTATGDCISRPGICTDAFDPVCGCDGRTYGNACSAAAAGVSVAATGACPRDLTCSTNADCRSTELCGRPAGTCTGTGMCTTRPDLCTAQFDPVCGCDGRTYSNGCAALAAGVSVASTGACPPPPSTCASTADCPTGTFCDRPVGACSATGTCQARPDACAADMDPVCGCDAQTYSSTCAAALAGVTVAATGACAAGVCTGQAGCGSAEVVAPEAPVVPRLEVTCHGGDATARGECEAAGFVAPPATAAPAARRKSTPPSDLGRQVTRRREKKLRDGTAFFRLKLNALGRRLLRKADHDGKPLAIVVVVNVRTAGGQADIRQLVELRKHARGR